MAKGGQVEHYDSGGLTPALQMFYALQNERMRQQDANRQAQINTKQQFDDYMNSVRGGTVKPTLPTMPTTPVAQPVAGVVPNQTPYGSGGGGGGRGQSEDPNPEWTAKTDAEKAAWYAEHPNFSAITQAGQNIFGYTGLGMLQDKFDPGFVERQKLIAQGIDPGDGSLNSTGGPLQYSLGGPEAQETSFGNFYDAPLSSRTDVSGYPLQESQLRSLERGMTSNPVKKGDPFAGYFSSDPTLNQIAKYADPSTQPAGFFPAGTAYTDKAFFRDSYGNLFAPGDSIPAGTTASGNMALANQNTIAGSAMQRALESQAVQQAPSESAPVQQAPEQSPNENSYSAAQQEADRNTDRDSNPGEGGAGGGGEAKGGLLHAYKKTKRMASGGKNTSLRSVVGTMRGVEHLMDYADGGSIYNLGSYSDGGRLLKGPGDGVSDSIPATIGKGQPARLADGEFVIPARIVSEIGNGSTDAGARKLYAMMDRIQSARGKTVGKGKVAKNTRADKYLPG
jgi:hypothetical protein